MALFIKGNTLECTATPSNEKKSEKDNLDCTNIPYNENENAGDQDYFLKSKERINYHPPNNLPIIKGITTKIFIMLHNKGKSFMILKEWRDMYNKLIHTTILYEEKEMTTDVLIKTKDFRFSNEIHLVPKTQ